MAATKRVTIVQQMVLQYRQRFYELLQEQLNRDGVQLTLIHSNPPPDEDVWGDAVDFPWAHRVAASYVPVGSSSVVWQRCHDLLRGSDLVIVEQGSRHLLNYLLAAEQVLGLRNVCLWGHGRSFRGQKVSRPAEWAKSRLSRVAHWWFAYTDLSADVVAATGFPRDRITVVQNAIDTRELARTVASLGDEDRVRADLALGPGHVGVYLGKLSRLKRLDYLCRSADVVRELSGDFELLIAGAGTEQGVVTEFARTRPWVHLLGPRFGRDKAELLRIADVVLMPAWAGLVVLDAFAAEVPLVASASQAHPPEISYIHDGVNGVVVDDGGSHRRYGEAVAALLGDPGLRAVIAEGCRASRERYTVEEMADRFGCGVRQALR